MARDFGCDFSLTPARDRQQDFVWVLAVLACYIRTKHRQSFLDSRHAPKCQVGIRLFRARIEPLREASVLCQVAYYPRSIFESNVPNLIRRNLPVKLTRL